MNQLPSEILGEIFLYLHPRDKVDCMLVCHRWKKVIEQFAIYRILQISSTANLNKLTAMVKKNPGIGKNVEYLRVHFLDEVGDLNLNKLLTLLCNLRSLFLTGPEEKYLNTKKTIMYPWSKYIEVINEYACSSVAHSLLVSNICPNLIAISIDDSCGNIIPLLRNAPILKSLTLRGYHISFDDLDAIHENAPCLESFTGYLLTLKKSGLTQNGTPTTLLTACNFVDVWVTDLKTAKMLLLYTSRKYPNLSKFECTFIPGRTTHCNKEQLAESDWFPLFQSVRSQLKQLSICNYGWVDNTFSILDRFNCHIEDFGICRISSAAFMNIVESQQILCIHTLNLDLLDFETYSWLREFQALKKLRLSHSRYKKKTSDVGLDAIVNNSPPTLISLSLSTVDLVANQKFAGASNIESLTFESIRMPKGIDNFISRCFPKLSNLELKKCTFEEKRFNLEQIGLLNFSFISRFFRDDKCNILIITSANNERRCYSIRDHCENMLYRLTSIQPKEFYPSIKSQRQSETDAEPYFILLCKSLNTCKLA